MNVIAYTFDTVRTLSVEFVLYAEKFDGESFTPSEQTRRQHEQNLHRRKFSGQWPIDEETGEQRLH